MKRTKIIVSQTLIKDFLDKGTELPVCPLRIYLTRIEKTVPQEVTMPMMKGSYFEYLALGSGAPDVETVTELPQLKTGRKSVDQSRIETQATVFLNVVEKYQCNINETQIVYQKEWKNEANIWSDEYEIIIRGVVDFKGPINAIGIDGNNERVPIFFKEAIHDLKLTADVNNNFGPYGWGFPAGLDHMQATVYNYLVNLPFFYWVFDYKPKPEYKLIYKESGLVDKMEMHEGIRKVVENLLTYESNNWEPTPIYSLCKGCPVAAAGLCDKEVTKPDIIII